MVGRGSFCNAVVHLTAACGAEIVTRGKTATKASGATTVFPGPEIKGGGALCSITHFIGGAAETRAAAP
jgi:hypothetical protein